MRGLTLFLTGFFSVATVAAAEVPESRFEIRRVAIDPDRPEFDTEMNFAFVGAGTGWAVWKAYRQGHEKVLARPVTLDTGFEEPRGMVVELSNNPSAVFGVTAKRHYPVQRDVADGLVAHWSELGDDGRWRIVKNSVSHFSSWNPVQTFRSAKFEGMRPGGGSQIVVWQEFLEGGKTRLGWSIDSVLQQGERSGFIQSENLMFHPSCSRYGDSFAWAFWDEYSDGEQWIMGKQFYGPESKDASPVRISPLEPGTRSLNPAPLESDSEGLCVAWIKLTDVIGGDGVVDMIHTAHVAQLEGGEWNMIGDESGSGEGAFMLSGLLPDLRTGKGYPSGYSGDRRKPLLLDAGDDGVWMLWERKSVHGGSGTKTAGQLLGRRFQNGKWVEGPLLIHEGLINYRLATPAKVHEDGHSFFVVGSKVPHAWSRPSYLVQVDLRKAETFEQDDWRDQFEPVTLPLADETEERHTAKVDGKTYQLFWGDLHCHSGLTGDAEGEPDEILLYGRDRARLDVMVLQDNDEVHGRPLTDGEYQLGVSHSQWITEPDRFVALPGYEWTQRTSKNGVPRPFESAFEQKIAGGYPNHRTIIYPGNAGPIVRYFEVGHHFKLMADQISAAGGILHSQHPAFEITDHPAETNLEVTACWGIYIRNVPAKFHGELDKGRQMGFIGTSDSHRRNPGLCGGLTGIWAEELTTESIFDALKSHRVFATNGSKIILESRANGRLSDQVVNAGNRSVDLTLLVQAPNPVKSVRLMGTAGKTVATFEGDGTKKLQISKTLNNLPKGDHWFYWAVEIDGNSTQYAGNISVARGNLAWSSPHFVEVK